MSKVNTSMKITSLLVVLFLIFSMNTNSAFSAGNLAPKSKTPTRTPTKTPTPSFAPTSTPTITPTPISQGILPSQINGGPGVVTISNLVLGMQYRIVISGVVNYNSSISGDAQWNDYQMTYGCFCRYSLAVYFNNIALSAQNGQTVYDPNHTYTFLWLADSAQLQMYIGDSYYTDNFGSLTFQMFTDVFIGTVTPSFTPTFTKTSTPSNTPTSTFTPTKTFTPTATATFTPTITPTPNRSGSGTCWASGASWPNYYANYTIDANTIPTGWQNSIDSAANTWTNVTPSHFVFSNLAGTDNVISKGALADLDQLALTSVYATSTTPITKVVTVFSDTKPFDTGNPPASGNYSVENVMTHEFGHWLYLIDIYDLQNCGEVTMYGYVAIGETKKISLEAADQNAINWQYP